MSRLRRRFIAGRIFFVSNNCLQRRTNFADRDFEALASAMVRVRARRHFLFTGYVFMPDHWHALIYPGENDSLSNLMNAIKVASTQGINRLRGTTGSLWQSRYYDHAIRSVKEYHERLNYMHLNPVRGGLVWQPEEWPWSSIHSCGGPGPVRLDIDPLQLPVDENTPL